MTHQRRIATGRPTARTGLLLGLVIATVLAAGCQTPISLLRQRGLRAIDRHNPTYARQQFQRIADRRPADWQANYYLGRIALDNDQPDIARVHLESAYSVRSAHGSPNAAPPMDRPDIHKIVDALAQALYDQGDHVRLIGFCDEAIDRFGRVGDYLRKAGYLQKLGDPDSTLVVYEQAARIAGPDDPSAQLALADFYQAMGQDDRAVLALRRAYTIDPQAPEIADRLRAVGVVPGPTIRVMDPNQGR